MDLLTFLEKKCYMVALCLQMSEKFSSLFCFKIYYLVEKIFSLVQL